MLRGDKIGLRARLEADVPVLHAELYEDVATRACSDTRPWRPMAPADSPYALQAPSDAVSFFSVLELATDELAGEALLWGIDAHNRTAHLGMSLRPSFRGRGLGVDVVRVLCAYGFAVRGMQRLQLETLADNAAMRGAALRAGFTQEGHLRRAAWVNGEFADELIFGQLASEWDGRHRPVCPAPPSRVRPRMIHCPWLNTDYLSGSWRRGDPHVLPYENA